MAEAGAGEGFGEGARRIVAGQVEEVRVFERAVLVEAVHAAGTGSSGRVPDQVGTAKLIVSKSMKEPGRGGAARSAASSRMSVSSSSIGGEGSGEIGAGSHGIDMKFRSRNLIQNIYYGNIVCHGSLINTSCFCRVVDMRPFQAASRQPPSRGFSCQGMNGINSMFGCFTYPGGEKMSVRLHLMTGSSGMPG